MVHRSQTKSAQHRLLMATYRITALLDSVQGVVSLTDARRRSGSGLSGRDWCTLEHAGAHLHLKSCMRQLLILEEGAYRIVFTHTVLIDVWDGV